jgi:hypothetical protein
VGLLHGRIAAVASEVAVAVLYNIMEIFHDSFFCFSYIS